MNQKTAKAARRLARRISHGWPDRQLVTYGTNDRTAVNNRKTTRGVYRQIKVWVRHGETLASIENKIAAAGAAQ